MKKVIISLTLILSLLTPALAQAALIMCDDAHCKTFQDCDQLSHDKSSDQDHSKNSDHCCHSHPTSNLVSIITEADFQSQEIARADLSDEKLSPAKSGPPLKPPSQA